MEQMVDKAKTFKGGLRLPRVLRLYPTRSTPGPVSRSRNKMTTQPHLMWHSSNAGANGGVAGQRGGRDWPH